MIDREKRRLDRQFDAFAAGSPWLGSMIDGLKGQRAVLVRLPLAIVLVLGSGLAVLPIFGLWMLPLGLLLLAIDLPVLRPIVSTAIIRLRRRWAGWRRWWKAVRDRDGDADGDEP